MFKHRMSPSSFTYAEAKSRLLNDAPMSWFYKRGILGISKSAVSAGELS